jgi:myosin-crossreactive antigen
LSKWVTVTPHPSRYGVLFDYDAIREAIFDLGIKAPVVVKWSGARKITGSHRYHNRRHVITVSSLNWSGEASKTLWHELAHARQMEQMGNPDKFHAEYAREGQWRSVRFDENKFEIEAREMEDRHYELPLAYYEG